MLQCQPNKRIKESSVYNNDVCFGVYVRDKLREHGACAPCIKEQVPFHWDWADRGALNKNVDTKTVSIEKMADCFNRRRFPRLRCSSKFNHKCPRRKMQQVLLNFA